MTVDIRTAAHREAEQLYPKDMPKQMRTYSLLDFEYGAVWAASRVTPTREQLIERIAGKYFAEHLPGAGEHTVVSVPLATSIADIVGDLIEDLAEGGHQ